MTEQTQRAIIVKRKNEKQWMKLEGVVAVGVGMVEEQAGIIISVEDDPKLIRKQIPSSINGVKVVIQQTGEIRAQ